MPDRDAWLITLAAIVIWSVVFVVLDGEYLVKLFGG